MEQIFYFIAELTVAAGVFYALKWYLKTHQNDFEKRLESYCPPSPLPEARQLYLTKRKRILKYLFTTVAIVFLLIPFLFIGLCVDFEVIRQMDSVPYLLFGYILVTSITTFVPYLLIIFYIFLQLLTHNYMLFLLNAYQHYRDVVIIYVPHAMSIIYMVHLFL